MTTLTLDTRVVDSPDTSEMPLALAQALREFGLMDAFRTCPRAVQNHYKRSVAAVDPGSAQRERIAAVLDALFLEDELTFE